MKKFLILSAIVLSVFAVSAIAQTNSAPVTNAPAIVATTSPVSFSNGTLSISLPNIGLKDYAVLIFGINLLAQGINNYYLKRNPKAAASSLGKLVAHIAVDPLPATNKV